MNVTFVVCFFFFFKQKTAYELRISDWSSDVCSSDLRIAVAELLAVAGDVGAQTGNVDSRIPVHVKGHVVAGYQVKSKKDVIVEHNVEDAIVRAGGSVVVKEGIRGHASEVFSPHDVQAGRSEEHTSELQSLMRISYAVFCLKKKK